MERFILIAALGGLAACQPGESPVLSQLTAPSAAQSGPMRPSGTAFDVAQKIKVTDFATCAGVGVVIAVSQPAQCVHEGVTYTAPVAG